MRTPLFAVLATALTLLSVSVASAQPRAHHRERARAATDSAGVVRLGCGLDDSTGRCNRYLMAAGRIFVLPLSAAIHRTVSFEDAVGIGPTVIVTPAREAVIALGITARF